MVEYILLQFKMLSRTCDHNLVAMHSLTCMKCGHILPYAEIVTFYQAREGKFIKRANHLRQYKDAVTKSKKLILFLDIDNTILYVISHHQNLACQDLQHISSSYLPQHHAFRLSRDIISKRATYASKADYRTAFLEAYLTEAEDFFCGCPERNIKPTAVDVASLDMTIVFRPGIFHFLRSVYGIVAITISTLGTQEYAQEVIKLIDPHRMLIYELLDRKLADSRGDTSTEVQHDDGDGNIISLSAEPNSITTTNDFSKRNYRSSEEHIMKGVKRFLNGIPLLIDHSVAIDNSSEPWRGTQCGFLKSFDFFIHDPEDHFDYTRQQQIYPFEFLSQPNSGYCRNRFNLLAYRNNPAYNSRFRNFSIAQLTSFINILRLIQAKLHPADQKENSAPSISAREVIEKILETVLVGCVFYIPFLSNSANIIAEGAYIQAVQWKYREDHHTDFRVELIRLLGGRIATTFGTEVTHVLISETDESWRKSFNKCAPLLLKCKHGSISTDRVKNTVGDYSDMCIQSNSENCQSAPEIPEFFVVPETFASYEDTTTSSILKSALSFYVVTQSWLMTSALLYRRQEELFYTRYFLWRGVLTLTPEVNPDDKKARIEPSNGDTNFNEKGRPVG